MSAFRALAKFHPHLLGMEPVNLAAHLGPPPAINDPALRFNRAEHLAPVDLWLLVKHKGQVMHARRTGHIESKGRDMQYEFADGTLFLGKLEWTYP